MSGSYSDAASVLAIAQDCLGQGDAQKAYIKAKRALNLFNKESDFDGAGRALITLVGSYIAAGKLQDAKQIAEGMQADFKKAGQQKQEVMAMTCMAEVLFALGKPENALSTAAEAADLAQSVRDREAEGIALRTSIKVNLSIGNTDDALQMTFRAADLCRECKDVEGEALELLAAAEILLSRAEHVDAFSTAKKAAKLFQSVGNALGQANALATAASAAAVNGVVKQSSWRSGDAGDGAIQMSTAALRLYKSVGDVPGQMSAGNMLASFLMQVGEYEQAEKIGQDTADVCAKAGLSEQQGEALITVSDAVLQRMSARSDSLSEQKRMEMLNKAVAVATDAVSKQPEFSTSDAVQAIRAKALYQFAQATYTQTKVLGTKSTQACLDAIRTSVQIQKDQKDEAGEARSLLLLSEVALMHKNIDEAADSAERAKQLFKDLVDRPGEKKATAQVWALMSSSLWRQRTVPEPIQDASAPAGKELKFLPGIAPGAQGLQKTNGGMVYIFLDNLKGRAAKNIGGKDKK
mmetsp:Transcript_85519/g.147857  ORF Transcript_85519/g.147857 Transcript_85519/m.147857 type:complete len:521 (+) Transcript_85519:93-1655(+)